MRVALIGGTGFVGGYLVDALIRAGHHPSLLVRPGSEEMVTNPRNCRIVSGDIGSTSALDTTLEDCDAVIYNIGILRENRKRGITFEALQYNGVVYTVKSAQRHGITRFLLMSANGVIRGGTPYQDTKYRAEKYLKKNELDVTIFRPSVIWGDPRGNIEIATQLYHDMVMTPVPAAGFFTGWRPASGQVLMSPVHVEDIASALVNSLEDSRTFGKTYELGGPGNLTWNEIIRRISDAAGRDKWIFPVPIAFMKIAATFFDWLPFFPVTRDQLTMLAQSNVAEAADLKRLVGRPLRQFTTENIAYLID